jgi:hypothetical protein
MKLLVIALNGMGCVGEDGGSDQTNVQCRAIQEYHKNLLPVQWNMLIKMKKILPYLLHGSI